MCEKENIATYEEMKAEAVSRMKIMGIFKLVIEQDNHICQSEYPFGAYYRIEEDLKGKIAELEEHYCGLVYSVIRSRTDIGLLDSCLWVSKYKDEWERDREDIATGIVFSYVINWEDGQCSEFGSIGFRLGIAGGLLRTA